MLSRGTSGSISAIVCALTIGSIDTAPAGTPVPSEPEKSKKKDASEPAAMGWRGTWSGS